MATERIPRVARAVGRLALVAWLLGAGPVKAGDTRVVVLVFDGVAASTLEIAPTPTFDRIRREGTFTHAMVPPFPSISLIGGVTLSTGCWPAKHGIVTNRFLDPERGLYDHSSDADWLTGCEHLHEVAERQGIRSAALGWYGSHSSARGPLASVTADREAWLALPDDVSRAERVATELERSDALGPRLVLAYFPGPDGAQHASGLESSEAKEAVTKMDAAVARVLEATQSGPPTSVLVTTDHGMRPVESLVNIERILRWHDIPARAISTGTTSLLYFEDKTAIDRAVRELARYEAFEVFRSDALPDYAKLGSGPRVGDLIVAARPPYVIEDAALWPAAMRWLRWGGPRFLPLFGLLHGSHGYAPEVPGVHGVLYAVGAGIPVGRQAGAVPAIDLHPTVASLLGIEAGPDVDGAVSASLLGNPAR